MIAGIILAAGFSERMKSPKPFLIFEGKTFIEIVAEKFRDADVSPVIIVTNPAHEEQWRGLKKNLKDVSLIKNPEPERGQFSSLIEGLKCLTSPECGRQSDKCSDEISGVMISLIDHPQVSQRVFDDLVKTHKESPERIIIPSCAGRQGHPIILPEGLIESVLTYSGEMGLKGFINIHADLIRRINADDKYITQDIDSPTDFRGMKSD